MNDDNNSLNTLTEAESLRGSKRKPKDSVEREDLKKSKRSLSTKARKEGNLSDITSLN